MSLHAKIMAMPCAMNSHDWRSGHQSARHAAAELALQQDAVVEKLVDSLEQAVAWLKVSGLSNDMPVMQNARAALASLRGESHG